MKKDREEFESKVKEAVNKTLENVTALMKEIGEVKSNMQLTRDEEKSQVGFNSIVFYLKKRAAICLRLFLKKFFDIENLVLTGACKQ